MKTKRTIFLFLVLVRCGIAPLAAAGLGQSKTAGLLSGEYVPVKTAISTHAFKAGRPVKKLAFVSELKLKTAGWKRRACRYARFAASLVEHCSLKPVLSFGKNEKLVSLSGFKMKIRLY